MVHKPLAWGKATITRSATTSEAKVPAGTFQAVTWSVAIEGGAKFTYLVEAAPPYRLLRWSSDAGEDAVLVGSSRQSYWKLNGPEGEKHLKDLGLKAPHRQVE
jgi:hypothetical protein